VTPPPGRTLWLLRHAKAVADPPEGEDDFDRVLAPRGRRDATALGHLLARRDTGRDSRSGTGTGSDTGSGSDTGPAIAPLPQLALVSPAARTMATADLVLAGLVPTPRRKAPDDLYGADPEDVLTHLRQLDDDVMSVMVVGHNPTAQWLALGLLGRKDKDREKIVRRGFPTCALGVYRLEIAGWKDVDGECAVLVELLTPPFEEG
jgi:phosphohistidine phosphatase